MRLYNDVILFLFYRRKKVDSLLEREFALLWNFVISQEIRVIPPYLLFYLNKYTFRRRIVCFNIWYGDLKNIHFIFHDKFDVFHRQSSKDSSWFKLNV